MLKELFYKEIINPGFIGIFVNPFYFAKKGLYENISYLSDKITGDILDVGCGQKPYEHLFKSKRYIGLELDTTESRETMKADFYYDGDKFPFIDNDFDSVIANEVFEHVFNPINFLSEIRRVLKPGGMLLLTVPFVWDEHEQPYDYARYSSFGLKHLLESNGFEIVEMRKSIQDIRVIFQLLNTYFYKKTVTRNGYINVLSTVLIMAPITILGIVLNWFLPQNRDLYLDNCIIARKKEQ